MINIRFFWFFINVIIWTIIFAIIGIVGSLFEWRGKFLSWIAQTWSKFLLAVGGLKYRVVGLDNLDPRGNYVFAANHESALDIPLAFGGLPYHIVAIAKIELKRIPIFGWAMMAGGHFFVDRTNHSKALNSLDKAKASMVKNPRSIIIYPEGTRSINGEIKPFKKGGLIMALQMGIPVVPIALCGTRNALGKKGLVLRGQTLELRIGKPILTQHIQYEDRRQFVMDVRQEVVALKKKWHHAA
ncbi:MAG: 1-acyl-sn-glycerol-3-phosphate acyltransferase [Candidatus Marinimicrobia bacterium]|nr:1-acyl-sn-glycerol-3-phosphate acyltransferase [Candidatus Neomarinimicrobiota bacterium]MBL7010157.1 1-acyl-sn-glycerol-3-phosphate acyltransferase [Candidatus Neomarinimicrobiota bacterium]MBL7030422.1 1-acyl-sn-glycerol-3-phosphate acyltransferase [Candidatus Neomarinimicrobiota bacterium]